MPPFHLAIPVTDLERARAFYGDLLGCREGRSAERWVDFDFHGHQLVVHRCAAVPAAAGFSHVDGVEVPVPHFGVVLDVDAFEATIARIKERVTFLIEPRLRFAGTTGEQRTAFFLDPFGNAIELKALTQPGMLFAPSA